VLTLAGAHLARSILHAPDYGVSCVWAGVVGALGVSVARTLRRRPNLLAAAALAGCCLILVILAALVGSPLVRAEHVLAVVLGAAATVRCVPRANALRARASTP
jgi:CHASE2 domain-containing sensor protein